MRLKKEELVLHLIFLSKCCKKEKGKFVVLFISPLFHFLFLCVKVQHQYFYNFIVVDLISIVNTFVNDQSIWKFFFFANALTFS